MAIVVQARLKTPPPKSSAWPCVTCAIATHNCVSEIPAFREALENHAVLNTRDRITISVGMSNYSTKCYLKQHLGKSILSAIEWIFERLLLKSGERRHVAVRFAGQNMTGNSTHQSRLAAKRLRHKHVTKRFLLICPMHRKIHPIHRNDVSNIGLVRQPHQPSRLRLSPFRDGNDKR